jgi:arginyl-tRNA synthetase
MSTDPKAQIEAAVRKALEKAAPGHADAALLFERPKQASHGDFSINVALQLAKALGTKPRELAVAISDAIVAATPAILELIERPEVAGPGFINFRLKAAAKANIVRQVLEQGKRFGSTQAGQGEKVQVEFVSANPTGPLHVGHGRQGALGDAIAALLEFQGYRVTREFYYNDAGAQIDKLAWSVQARKRGLKPGDAGWPEEGYAGEYIDDIAREFGGGADDLEGIRTFAVAYLRKEQDADLQAFGVKFDVYYLESSLYSDGKVEAVIDTWTKNGKCFEKDGALWLRTTEYGDDKDRVARKSDGSYT